MDKLVSDKCTNVTVNKAIAVVRHSDGGYLFDNADTLIDLLSSEVGFSSVNCTRFIKNRRSIMFSFKYNSAIKVYRGSQNGGSELEITSTEFNNYLIGVSFYNLELEFS